MDSALKQRLLGALVLIALAVIFVPMLLSGPAPRHGSENVDIDLPPEPEGEFQTRVLPVPQPQSRPATPTPSTTPAPVSGAPASDPVQSERIVAVDTNAPVRPDLDAQPPQPAPAAKPTPPPVEATPAAPPAGLAANGRFFVHMGVYATAKNADDLAATLKRGGFPALTEATDFQGRSAQRVRVGPFADRASAEAARLRIRSIKPDVPSSIVSTPQDATADAPPSAVPAGKPGGWVVQVSALKSADDANKLRDRLRGAGFAAFVDKIDADGQTLWRVRAGPEADRANAETLRGRIKDKLKLDGRVVVQ